MPPHCLRHFPHHHLQDNISKNQRLILQCTSSAAFSTTDSALLQYSTVSVEQPTCFPLSASDTYSQWSALNPRPIGQKQRWAFMWAPLMHFKSLYFSLICSDRVHFTAAGLSHAHLLSTFRGWSNSQASEKEKSMLSNI